MLQLVKNERQAHNPNSSPQQRGYPKSNYLLIELCDDSLSPVALPGDFAVIAQYAAPIDGDMVAYQHKGEIFVRWWRRLHSSVWLTDGAGNEEIIPLSEILVLGVVREIRRPIVNGSPPQRQIDVDLETAV